MKQVIIDTVVSQNICSNNSVCKKLLTIATFDRCTSEKISMYLATRIIK